MNRERMGGNGAGLNPDKEAGPDVEALVRLALDQGATKAAVIESSRISAEDELASLCRRPGCENHGLSASCPPHVGGPKEFRKLVPEMGRALVFKIEVPSQILLSSQKREIGRLVHQIASEIETTALARGAKKARAFVGGSCKRIFCDQKPDCRVVDSGGECRHADQARPSMSGFGINVKKMVETAGWRMWETGDPNEGGKDSMGTVVGLVLIA